jgi:hypothetical protein
MRLLHQNLHIPLKLNGYYNICFNILELCILPIECICVSLMVLIINSINRLCFVAERIVFHVRYEIDSYISFRRNLNFKEDIFSKAPRAVRE